MLVDLENHLLFSISDKEKESLEKLKHSSDNQTYKFLYHDLCRRTYNLIKAKWLVNSKRRIIVFLSSLDLAQELFKKEAIFVAVPNTKLFNDIKSSLPQALHESVEKSRIDIIARLQQENYYVFKYFEQIENVVRDTFRLGDKL